MAHIRLLSDQDSIKCDPSSIISVPLGVEVRPIYGAPQLIPQAQPASPAPSTGGFLSRLREAKSAPTSVQPELTAPILAEIILQPGQRMPEHDSVQLGPLTSSKLQTINVADYGGELFISKSAFLASSATVNIHNHPASGVPGLSLQRVDGEGNLVLKVSGQAILKDLAPGEQVFVQANRIVAVESSVQVLGGENRLLTNLVGPGRVLLSSLPSLEMALASQSEQTQQLAAAAGLPSSGAMSPFGMGGGGGGLGSMVMQGMAFGVGSSIAHHAIGSAFGGGAGGAAPAAEAAQPPPPAAPESDAQDISENNSGSGESDGSIFGSMFGGGDEGNDGDDGDWE